MILVQARRDNMEEFGSFPRNYINHERNYIKSQDQDRIEYDRNNIFPSWQKNNHIVDYL